MKKAFAWLMLLTVMTLFTFSVATTPVKAHERSVWLLAGSPHYGTPWWDQHKMLVGWVTIWNDEYLHVEYSTIGDWYLTETHLAVVTDWNDFPMTKKGNPKVGHFPYKHEGLDSTYDEYIIPLEVDWELGTTLYIAAHAVVEKRLDTCVLQEETAWANCGGINAFFPGNNWATYTWYIVQ